MRVVQNEPADWVDPDTVGLYAAIGIRKGQPFAPDARMKKTLTEAVAVGNAYARANAIRIARSAEPGSSRTGNGSRRSWEAAISSSRAPSGCSTQRRCSSTTQRASRRP